MMGIDPIGAAIGALAHSILGSRILPAPRRPAVPKEYSFRHVRPFPMFSPFMEPLCAFTLEDVRVHQAWAEENARREVVRIRWRLRQAERAARPPKGHDHPDWI